MGRNKQAPPWKALGEVPLFADCSKRELTEADRLCCGVSVGAGRVLAREAARGDELFVIQSGRADVSIMGCHVATLYEGEVFGEMALLGEGMRLSTVTADTDMDVLVFSRREFASLLQSRTGPRVGPRLRELAATRRAELESFLARQVSRVQLSPPATWAR
jgi:CRP-like cAMP-binding protein